MAHSKRLVFVRRSFTAFGGGELILQSAMERLKSRGYDISIIAQEWNAGSDIRHIPCRPPRTWRPLRARSFARAACNAVANIEPALVQSNERIPCCDILRAGDGVHRAYLERRARHFGTGARLFQNVSPFHNDLLRLEREALCSPRVKAVIAISQMVKQDIEKYFELGTKKVVHIPNGVDLDKFTPHARDRHRHDVRQRMQVHPDSHVTLFVGSGFARKGLAVAIQAIAKTTDAGELWVAGSDSRISRYRSLAEQSGVGHRVRFLGAVGDMVPLYGAADAVVMPSYYEPFGSVALEGLASGLPVVVSEDSGAAEAVVQLNPALIARTGSIESTANALSEAIAVRSSSAARSAARTVAERYGVETMVDRMLDLYNVVDID
jgi:UDP-glucose:(heptosyl)LPS alpha-1,3-glucosyltransferase